MLGRLIEFYEKGMCQNPFNLTLATFSVMVPFFRMIVYIGFSAVRHRQVTPETDEQAL